MASGIFQHEQTYQEYNYLEYQVEKVVDLLNAARKRPKEMVIELKDDLEAIRGTSIVRCNRPCFRMFQARKSINSLIVDLETHKNCSQLIELNSSLFKALSIHAELCSRGNEEEKDQSSSIIPNINKQGMLVGPFMICSLIIEGGAYAIAKQLLADPINQQKYGVPTSRQMFLSQNLRSLGYGYHYNEATFKTTISFCLSQDFIPLSDLQRIKSWSQAMSAQIVKFINKVRTNLYWTLQELQKKRDLVNKEGYLCERGLPPVYLKQGREIIQEPIEAVRKLITEQKDLQPLKWNGTLASIASEHCQELDRHNYKGHERRDFAQDIKSHYAQKFESVGKFSQNISYSQSSGLASVWNCLIDSGVPSRGHRKNILSSSFSHIGVACRQHRGFVNVQVVQFSDDNIKE